jgi:hypothetical protein
MGKMNVGRVVLGGIVAGIVGDILGTLIDGMMLSSRWAAGMSALGHPGGFSVKQIVAFNLIGIVVGIVAVWIYAAIRPRFGAGPKTAIYAGLALWIVGYAAPDLGFMYVPHLFPHGLTAYTALGALFEAVLGTLAGAALYKEAEG